MDVDGKATSLADRDRASKDRRNIKTKITEKIRSTSKRISHGIERSQAIDLPHPPEAIEQNLSKERERLTKDLSLELKKSNLLKSILRPTASPALDKVSYSPHEVAEIENLATTINLRDIYKENWHEQRAMIESAGPICTASRRLTNAGKESELKEYQRKIIGGRAIAKEIIAKVNLYRAKDDLDTFTKTKQFHKFPVSDLRSESYGYFSLKDIDISSTKSLLDQVVDVLIEGKEHRRIRKAIDAMVKERGQRLKGEYLASIEIVAAASNHASEFKKHSFLSHSEQPVYEPLFTRQEISTIEFRAGHTKNPKEAAKLRSLLDRYDFQEARSLASTLGDFENRVGSRLGSKDRDDSKAGRIQVKTTSDEPVHQTFLRETPSKEKSPSRQQSQQRPISIQH